MDQRGGRGQRPGRGQRGSRGGGRGRRGGQAERGGRRERRNEEERFVRRVEEPRRDRPTGRTDTGNRGGRVAARGRAGGGYRGTRGRGHARNHQVEGTSRTYTISDRLLRELKEKSPRDITLEFSSKLDSFNGLLNSRHMERDRLRLVLELLAKGCASTMNQMLSDMLGCVLPSTFFVRSLAVYLTTLTQSSVTEHVILQELEEDLDRVATLIGEMLMRFPSQAAEISLLDKLKVTVDQLQAAGTPLTSGFTDRVDELLTSRDDSVMHAEFRQQKNVLPLAMKLENPPDDFRTIGIVPTSDEIAENEQPFLRPNIVGGGFRDLDQYLDIQFRLLREDFVGPLREGIATLPEDEVRRRRGNQNDIRLYHNARIGQPVCTFSGLTHQVRFDVSRLRRVNWQHSRRLIYGSLLCFSNDHFKTIKLATVTNRKVEDLQHGQIEVRFMNGLRDVHDMLGHQTFTIAESPAYFEAYRHVLRRLQRVGADLPLQTYIVQCKRDEMKPPRYLRPENRDGEVAKMDLRNALDCKSPRARDVKVTDWDAWPPCEYVNLDGSQLSAMKTAMTREFALIQGPPGTGKTYIGLKVMRALLDNRSVWDPRENSPILVVCYTNHALDQFLEGILQFHRNGIVRVGGRSESEALKDLNLTTITGRLRRDRGIPGTIFHNQKRLRFEMHKMKDSLQDKVKELERRGVMNVKWMRNLPGCDKAGELSCRGEYQRRGYSLLDEWLGIVCNDSEATAEPNPGAQQDGTVGSTGGDDQPEANAETSSENGGEAEVDEEAELLEAQRRIDGDEFVPIEGRRAPEQGLEDPENEPAVEEAVAALVEGELVDQQEDEEGGWTVVKMSKVRRNQKVRESLSRPPMTEEEVSLVHDIWELTEENRWRLYNYWLKRRREYLQQEMDSLCRDFEGASARLREADEQESLHVLQSATVIGMTTTGAAKHHGLLLEVKPKIIVVEEAAEVYEAHIVTTLSAAAEHLILIGDHQQLRPSPHVFRLAKKFNLDVSLFERMIKNGMPCQRLNVQHRMRPEIAELMRPIYDGLQNHESVFLYENIAGIKHNIFFIDHVQREAENEDLKSHLNTHEAHFAAALCRYVMQQGILASKITVLTTYTGQVLTLKKVMPKTGFQGVRITVVDNYQGEENDVIILSLVRSNDEGKIGFLNTSNRVCVALSRAKKGFYCVGNMALLAEKSELWYQIVEGMRTSGIVGPALDLCCQNHPDTVFRASKASDFAKAPEGGCTRLCQFRLSCGHVCALMCHPYDREHTQYQCRKACQKELCELGHPCPRKCYQECQECRVRVDKEMPNCGHIQKIPCYLNPLQFQCQAPCSRSLGCGHACRKKCGDVDCTNQCLEVVSKTWPCAHTAEIRCCEQRTRSCPVPCADLLDCDHPCTGTCGECLQGRLHKACQASCGRTLICSHSCNYPCTKNCPACERDCENACVHSRCQKKCGELCDPCREPCQWQCEHYMCGKLCGEPCDRQRCNERCRLLLVCGHRCIGLCGEKCPSDCRICNFDKVTEIFFGDEDYPRAKFVELEDCGHIFEVAALDRWMDSKEDENEGGGIHIGLKQCPRCKMAVRRSLRYGNVVKQALQDIETVKRKMQEQESQLQRTVRRLTSDAVALSGKLKNSSLFGKPISQQEELLRRFFDHSDLGFGILSGVGDVMLGHDSPSATILKRLRNRMTADEVRAIENQIQFLPSIVELAEKIEKAPSQNGRGLQPVCQRLLRDLDALVKFLMKITLSDQELEDFLLQLERLELELNFRIVMKKLEPRMTELTYKHRQYVDVVEKGLTGTRKRTLEDLEALRRTVKFLSETYGAHGISEVERREIVRALGLARGHWYKCPNGHPYAIGDCGGANERAVCLECREAIGGESHRLAEGNRLAPEMDGAQEPAWPM